VTVRLCDGGTGDGRLGNCGETGDGRRGDGETLCRPATKGRIEGRDEKSSRAQKPSHQVLQLMVALDSGLIMDPSRELRMTNGGC